MTGMGLNVVVGLEHLTYKIQSGVIPDLITDLVGVWKFNEASNSQVLDSHTAGPYNFTAFDGDPTLSVAGKVATARSLSSLVSSNDFRLINDDLSPNGGSFTFAFWWNNDGDAVEIATRMTPAFGNLEYEIGAGAGGELFGGIYKSGVSSVYMDSIADGGGATYTPNDWNFGFFGYDAPSQFMQMSLNGSAIFTKSLGGAMRATVAGLTNIFGWDVYGNRPIALDQIGLWHRLLGQDAVDYMWNGGAGRDWY